MKQLNRLICIFITVICIAWIAGGSWWLFQHISPDKIRWLTGAIVANSTIFILFSILPWIPDKARWNFGPRISKGKVVTKKYTSYPDSNGYRFLSGSSLQLLIVILLSVIVIDEFDSTILSDAVYDIIIISSIIIFGGLGLLLENKIKKEYNQSK